MSFLASKLVPMLNKMEPCGTTYKIKTYISIISQRAFFEFPKNSCGSRGRTKEIGGEFEVHKTGLLLVNLGFWISDFQISDSRLFMFLQNPFGKSGGELLRKT